MAERDAEHELLDAEQVAAILGMTTDWVYEQSRKGRIPTITLGRYRRYRRAAIEQWLLSIERASLGPTNKNGRAARARPRPGNEGVSFDAEQR